MRASGAQSVDETNKKFADEASFSFDFGNLQTFYGGVTGLVGPPRLINGSLMEGMKWEHIVLDDSWDMFTTSNDVTTNSRTEWHFIMEPDKGKVWKEPEFGEFGGEVKEKQDRRFPDRFEETDPRRWLFQIRWVSYQLCRR